MTGDVIWCDKKALDPNDPPVAFSAEEWSRLQETFPNGVCDDSRQNPDADNAAKRWSVPALHWAWDRACDAAGVARVSFQQGTRHATITALAQALPERVLRDFTRHRDPASLSHYAKPTAPPEAIVRVLRPGRLAEE